jgi:hypothetical protein
MLIMMDNSISMGEEQDLMAAAVPSLVSAFEAGGVDDIRVAVVSSDMGLSWGGNPYEDGDGWPGTNPCSASGDNGVFQSCPDVTGDWAETTPGSPNADLADEISCLADLGTTGCGFEQQLQAAARGLTRDDQTDFVRDGDLLVVLMVSDEEDCSMEDGPGLFATDEIQGTGDGPSALNVACGRNPEFLYTPAHYASVLRSVKGNAANGVLYAAIVGVPPVAACQGPGDQIEDCLEHEDMQLEEVIETNSAGQPAIYYAHACTREQSSVQVTKAMPARRMVEVAVDHLPGWSYVASICNADWTPHLQAIADMAADALDTY